MDRANRRFDDRRPERISAAIVWMMVLVVVVGAGVVGFVGLGGRSKGVDPRTFAAAFGAGDQAERAAAIVGLTQEVAEPSDLGEVLPGLVRSARDESPMVRGAAASTLVGLIERFGADGREPAIRGMGPEAEAALTELLDDPEPTNRATAARGLGMLAAIIGGDEPTPQLVDCLEDEAERVREAALDVVLRFRQGPERVVPVALRRLPIERGAVRMGFTRVFWAVHFEPSVLPLLVEGLTHDDPDVRLCCAAAINHMGPDARWALPAIVGLLRAELARPDPPGETPQSGFDTVAMAAGAIGQLAPDEGAVPGAVELLGEVLSRDLEAGPAAETAPGGVVTAQAESVRDERLELRRMQAAWALGMLGRRGLPAVPVLLSVVERSSDRAQGFAAEALVEIVRGTGEERGVAETLAKAWQTARGEEKAAIGRALRGLGPEFVDLVPELARMPADATPSRIRRANYPRVGRE